MMARRSAIAAAVLALVFAWHPAIGVAVVLLVMVSWTVVSVAGHGWEA